MAFSSLAQCGATVVVYLRNIAFGVFECFAVGTSVKTETSGCWVHSSALSWNLEDSGCHHLGSDIFTNSSVLMDAFGCEEVTLKQSDISAHCQYSFFCVVCLGVMPAFGKRLCDRSTDTWWRSINQRQTKGVNCGMWFYCLFMYFFCSALSLL